MGTCIRCHKPCPDGQNMCEECMAWYQQRTGKAAPMGGKKIDPRGGGNKINTGGGGYNSGGGSYDTGSAGGSSGPTETSGPAETGTGEGTSTGGGGTGGTGIGGTGTGGIGRRQKKQKTPRPAKQKKQRPKREDGPSVDPKMIGIIAAVALLVIGIIVAIVLLTKKKPEPPGPETYPESEVETEMSGDNHGDSQTEEAKESISGEESTGGSQAEVDEIIALYNDHIARYNAGEMEYDFHGDDIAYYLDGALVGVDQAAASDTDYSKEYYFKDGSLYLAILRKASNNTSTELYFYYDELVRWKDVDNQIHDRENTNSYNEWYDYQQEGYNLYSQYEYRQTEAASVTEAPAKEQPTETQAPTQPSTTAPTQAAGGDYIFPNSDSQYLSRSDLSGLSDWQLKLARNELYARRGRKFKDQELQNYFNGCSWYHGTIEPDSFDDDRIFNTVEKANRDLIISEEKARKSGSAVPAGIASSLAYAGNDYPDIDACTDKDAYQTVTSVDGTFSFGYPQNLFTEVSAEDDTYFFRGWDGDNLMYMLSVFKMSDPGDPMERAQNLYNSYIGTFSNTYFSRVSEKVGSDGFARALIGGHLDSAGTTGEYLIAANNGSESYFMIYTYYDYNANDTHSAARYVEDTIYRMCSFSGTSYKPRSYSQFVNEEMGSKK